MKLNQAVAIETAVKTKVKEKVTAIYHLMQKPALFDGMTRTYRPLDSEDKELYPNENKTVQHDVTSLLKETAVALTELYDATLTKDEGNMQGRATVEVDGEVILKDAPISFLLWLEHKLDDLFTEFSKVPTLDPAETWNMDVNSGMYMTPIVTTQRPKKCPVVITKAAATEYHPAQAEIIYEDRLVGYWDNKKFSGAIPMPTKKQYLQKIEKLQKAVKSAREGANTIDIQKQQFADKLFKWLLA